MVNHNKNNDASEIGLQFDLPHGFDLDAHLQAVRDGEINDGGDKMHKADNDYWKDVAFEKRVCDCYDSKLAETHAHAAIEGKNKYVLSDPDYNVWHDFIDGDDLRPQGCETKYVVTADDSYGDISNKLLIKDNLVKAAQTSNPLCLATNLFDGTLYNFRVRTLCKDPVLDPLFYDPGDASRMTELSWNSYQTEIIVPPKVAVSIPDRDMWGNPKTPTVVFNVLVMGHDSTYYHHMSRLANSSHIFIERSIVDTQDINAFVSHCHGQ
jgi:hypothetical protein